jgi:hypothetical protein
VAGAPRDRVDDEGQRTAGLQHVVNRLGHVLLVGPVEGLAEGHQPVRPGRDRGQVFGQALNPPDVHHSLLLGGATALRQHAGIRVQADRLGEQRGEADGEHARAATAVQKPAVPVQTRLAGQEGFEFR